MEMSNFDPASFDRSILMAPFMLIMLGVFILAWIAVQGGSLKLSLYMLLEQSPSYLKCLAISVLMIAINIGVSIGLFAYAGEQPWYYIVLYQLTIQAVLLTIMLRCSPFSAFLATICHSFFGGVGTVLLIIPVIVVLLLAAGGVAESQRQRDSSFSQQPSTPQQNSFVPSFSAPGATGAVSNPFAE